MASDSDSDSDRQDPDSTNISSGPQFIGPVIPSNRESSESTPGAKPDTDPVTSSTSPESFGPQLPPHMLIKPREPELVTSEAANTITQPDGSESRTIGPVLPPHLKMKLASDSEHVVNQDDSDYEEEETYGPLPPELSRNSSAHEALEERALQMRIDKLEPKNSEPCRESWMVELPEARAGSFGLGPRQFRKHAGPDLSDRSSWTEIAGEKGKRAEDVEKKVDLKAEAERRELEKRDEEFDVLSKKHKRKNKSLVDIHQEKLKKNNEGGSSGERRPFNREVDLQVNKFDDAQKNAILKKAQLLDDRFSSGKSKYL